MIPPSLQAIGIAAILAFLIGSSSAWYLTSAYKDAHWSAQVETTRAETAELSQRATEAALQKERESRLLLNTLEVEHETVRQSLDHVSRENRRLAAQLGGLRDPGTTRSGRAVPGAASVSGQHEGPADAGAGLSIEATEFLLIFAEQADGAASYAAACRAWSIVVTGEAVTPAPAE